jgi:hypothetical protein
MSLTYNLDGTVKSTRRQAEKLPVLSEDTCCSYEEWKNAGYFVKSGAKSQYRDALGIPQFTIEQVARSQRRVF